MLSASAGRPITSPLEPTINAASTSTSQNQPFVLESDNRNAQPKISATAPVTQEAPPASVQIDPPVTLNKDRLNLDLLLQKRSSPYELPGASIKQPDQTPPSVIPAPRMPSGVMAISTSTLPPSLQSALVSTAQTAPARPTLVFKLEKHKGVFDHEAPVSREDWCSYSLPEIFALVSRRSGQPLTSVSCLTLTYMWNEAELIVKRSQSSEDWKKLKARVKNEFKFGKKSYPNTINFEIWVSTGDITLAAQGEDDEDEGW